MARPGRVCSEKQRQRLGSNRHAAGDGFMAVPHYSLSYPRCHPRLAYRARVPTASYLIVLCEVAGIARRKIHHLHGRKACRRLAGEKFS